MKRERTKFIPLDYDYFDFKGRNYVRIIGRSNSGKRVLVVDEFKSNFWVVLKNGLSEKKIKSVIKKIEKIKVEKASRKTNVLKTEIHEKRFLGKDVKAIKIFIDNYKDAHSVADEIHFKEVEKRREYDLNLITKYIMEGGLEPLKSYEIEGENLDRDDFGGIVERFDCDVFLELKDKKELGESEKEDFKPKILGFDIETTKYEIGKGDILMISLYGLDSSEGKEFRKVLTWKKCGKKEDYVECLKDEEEMLRRFVEYVREISPDFLVGYYSDAFDLPYLRAAAEKNKIELNLGLDDSSPKFSRGRVITGRVNGIVHVDLFKFINYVYSQYLQSETLSLNDVASELLGEEKDKVDLGKIGLLEDGDDKWNEFFKYNLKDSKLTHDLMFKVWPDILEFSKIVKEPVFEITRNSMSSHVEDYLLHNLSRFNEIAEKRPLHDEISRRRRKGKYEGALVYQPKPGLYEDVCVFDFTSMHASIIVSFNISLSSLIEDKSNEKKKTKNITPEFLLDGKKRKYYFTEEKEFFPTLLEEVVSLRKKYKKEYQKDKNPFKRARSNAYKLLANASYGYLGFFGARYYCRECAASTLALVRKFTTDSMDKIKEKGHEIIFSDTDSIGFEMNKKSKKEVLSELKDINDSLPGIMELELEDFYKRGLFVSKRGDKLGAKKKYALLDYDNKLKVRGFETVRRDWCKLARDLQKEILESILKNGNEKESLEILKKTIERVKKRDVDMKELIMRNQLKKAISSYVSKGPHVIAAEKMEEQGLSVGQGDLIQYYISETKGNKKLVREKVKLPNEKGDYEIEYYLEKQILPVVENILEVFGVDVKEVIDGESQKTLF